MPKTINDHEYLGKEFYRLESIAEALCNRLVPQKTKKCISAEENDSGYSFFSW